MGKSVLGSSSKISGANLFTRLNYWVVACGGEIMTEPPVLKGVEAPSSATVVLSASAFTFTLDGEPANAENLKLIILASPAQSNGITRAYSKAVQIGGTYEPASEEYDIKAAYDAKNGAPTAAAPKVFLRYFFVNTKTGEKSGEMMAIAKLA